MTALAVLTFTTDSGAVAYTRLERPQPGEPETVAGGLLGGHPDLVAAVRQILTGPEPDRVRVIEPDVDYQFSPGRDSLADVAAALLATGAGRGRLSDNGWEALTAALGEDRLGDSAADSPVIH